MVTFHALALPTAWRLQRCWVSTAAHYSLVCLTLADGMQKAVNWSRGLGLPPEELMLPVSKYFTALKSIQRQFWAFWLQAATA